MNNLPLEIIKYEILQHLDRKDIFSFLSTCKNYFNIHKDALFWTQLCSQKFTVNLCSLDTIPDTPKEMYLYYFLDHDEIVSKMTDSFMSKYTFYKKYKVTNDPKRLKYEQIISTTEPIYSYKCVFIHCRKVVRGIRRRVVQHLLDDMTEEDQEFLIKEYFNNMDDSCVHLVIDIRKLENNKFNYI